MHYTKAADGFYDSFLFLFDLCLGPPDISTGLHSGLFLCEGRRWKWWCSVIRRLKQYFMMDLLREGPMRPVL
jgi:hypothetical protein